MGGSILRAAGVPSSTCWAKGQRAGGCLPACLTRCAPQVAVNWELAELGARERAMLEFALAVCRADSITEQHLARLAAHGFDREDAWDIGAIAAFFAMANRLAHCLALRPNAEFHTLGRGRAAPTT